jgi:2-polyprenyl-6-methoxyphenol hydroxylase-like FAD-dependent oxidoreductase
MSNHSSSPAAQRMRRYRKQRKQGLRYIPIPLPESDIDAHSHEARSTTQTSIQHKCILERTFAGIGWRVPEFLDSVRIARDMYFDSVARVDVANWARGRIALLGDASSCVSLFGDGSTLAIAGAYELAQALMESPADPQGAFSRYQAVHGKFVASKQKNLIFMASRIAPRTSTGIWISTRVFWRTMGGLGTLVRLGRKLRGK